MEGPLARKFLEENPSLVLTLSFFCFYWLRGSTLRLRGSTCILNLLCLGKFGFFLHDRRGFLTLFRVGSWRNLGAGCQSDP